MKYFISKFKDNWADEMYIEGIHLHEAVESVSLNSDLIEASLDEDGELLISFGTNEYNEYNSIEELEKKIQIREISNTEYLILSETIGKCLGHTSYTQFLEIK